MATNVAGQPTRDYAWQLVHYMRLKLAPTPGVFQPFGAFLPPGANILRVSTAIRTVFNGTTPTLDVGTEDDPNSVVAAGALVGTQGRNNATLVGAGVSGYAAPTRLGATLTGSGMNAGDGDVEIEFTNDNDR